MAVGLYRTVSRRMNNTSTNVPREQRLIEVFGTTPEEVLNAAQTLGFDHRVEAGVLASNSSIYSVRVRVVGHVAHMIAIALVTSSHNLWFNIHDGHYVHIVHGGEIAVITAFDPIYKHSSLTSCKHPQTILEMIESNITKSDRLKDIDFKILGVLKKTIYATCLKKMGDPKIQTQPFKLRNVIQHIINRKIEIWTQK